MSVHSTVQEQLVYDQLLWIERRRLRILNTVAAHLSVTRTEKAIALLEPPIGPSPLGMNLEDLVDEHGAAACVRRLGYRLQLDEARMIQALLQEFRDQAVELVTQIRSGAKLAGQEAGRSYIARNGTVSETNMPALYTAITQIAYFGDPSERPWFASVRPLSDVAIHIRACTQTAPWKEAGVDANLMSDLVCDWIDGALEIISPQIIHVYASAIPRGDSFGRHLFFERSKYIPL